jgi:hypothetical protein
VHRGSDDGALRAMTKSTIGPLDITFSAAEIADFFDRSFSELATVPT